MNNFVFFIGRILSWLIINFLFFPKIVGSKKNRHFRHSCIVVANHTSNWDPLLLGIMIRPVNIRYMAKEELFQKKFFGSFLLKLGVIPVNRGKSDLKAMKTALGALKSGQSLGMFPEGHRSKTGEMRTFESGAVMMSIKTNTPILPIYMYCKGYKPFHRTTVAIGDFLDFKTLSEGKSDMETVARLNELLFKKMTELKRSVQNA